MEQPLFFDSWASFGRIFLVGGLAYVALVAMLRISGKRTLSKMNAFDLVVTVALGSTLATVLLNRNVPLAEGVAALALLILLQYLITSLSVRSKRFQSLVKSDPTRLVVDGRFAEEALREKRVTHEEVIAALRQNGVARLQDAKEVWLETDGSLSVLKRGPEDGTASVAESLAPEKRERKRS